MSTVSDLTDHNGLDPYLQFPVCSIYIVLRFSDISDAQQPILSDFSSGNSVTSHWLTNGLDPSGDSGVIYPSLTRVLTLRTGNHVLRSLRKTCQILRVNNGLDTTTPLPGSRLQCSQIPNRQWWHIPQVKQWSWQEPFSYPKLTVFSDPTDDNGVSFSRLTMVLTYQGLKLWGHPGDGGVRSLG